MVKPTQERNSTFSKKFNTEIVAQVTDTNNAPTSRDSISATGTIRANIRNMEIVYWRESNQRGDDTFCMKKKLLKRISATFCSLSISVLSIFLNSFLVRVFVWVLCKVNVIINPSLTLMGN